MGDIFELKNKRKSDKRKPQSPISDYEDKKKVGRWTEQEDAKLQKLIDEYGEKSWRIISDMMEGRSAIQCLHRWTKILKPGLRKGIKKKQIIFFFLSKKGPWQEEEDEKLLQWVKSNGPCKWSICAENIAGRSGKQCRERWFNNLNPNVKKGGWTSEEDQEIFRGYLQHSSSWSKIAKNLVGRTENSVKNRFYSTVRKLLADQEKNGGLTLKQLENDTQNGTNALQTFVREQLAKYANNSMNIQIDEDNQKIEDDMKLEDSNEKSSDEESKSRKKQSQDCYQEQNLLYRLLQQQGGPIKRTSCMKDYSTIYKKYKKRYNQKKKDKKLSDKVENLKKMIMKREDHVESSVKQESIQSDFQNFQQSKNEASQNGDQDKMVEFQEKLLAFFNQQLNEVMKKFYQDIGEDGKQKQKLQMILTPEVSKMVSQNQQQESKSKRPKRMTQRMKIKEEEEHNEQEQVVQNFLQKFNHLGQFGSQIGQNLNDQIKQEEDNQLVQDAKIDQKMVFLISQLHTLENMLGDTKKEFTRLEASLYEKINNNSDKH